MNTWVRKSFKVGVLSAGVLLMGGTAAQADWNSIGNSGLGSGNQVDVTTQAPIDICGNAIGAAGNTTAGCEGGSWASLVGETSGNWNSFGNSGVGSGNQINATTQAPIDVCGNAVGAAGNSSADCFGGAAAALGGGLFTPATTTATMHNHHIRANKANGTESAHTTEGTTLNSFGNSGAGSGNQVNLVTQAPIDLCGNAIGAAGNTSASCVGGASATTNGDAGSTTMNSGFNSGIASGNQVNSLIQIPINVCGNAVGLFGNTQASCTGGSNATIGGTTPSAPGGGGGYSLAASPKAAKGVAKAYGHMMASSGLCSPTLNSFGNSGVGSGNQINAVTQAPVDISGNAIGGAGNTFASSVGGAWASC